MIRTDVSSTRGTQAKANRRQPRASFGLSNVAIKMPTCTRRCLKAPVIHRWVLVVYGTGEKGARMDGRIQYRQFDEETFLNDMAKAPFVMVNGGHSTICEALSLGKPVLAEPIVGQYEQIFNVEGLGEMGVGMGVRKLQPEDVLHFARCVPLMQKRAAQLNVVDNDGLIQQLHQCIQELNPEQAPVSTHLGHTPVLRPKTVRAGKLA